MLLGNLFLLDSAEIVLVVNAFNSSAQLFMQLFKMMIQEVISFFLCISVKGTLLSEKKTFHLQLN